MNLAQVARVLAGFCAFFSLSAGIPLCLSLLEPTSDQGIAATEGFLACTGIGLLLALLLRIGGSRAKEGNFFRKEGIAAVVFAWLLAGSLGALPFLWSGALQTGADALFEAFSGITTTGASVFGSSRTRTIESLPDSLLLWRAMLQWMGGLGIILAFLVLLPAMGVMGKNLLSTEKVGIADEAMRPRLQEQGRALFRLYLALTTLCLLLLHTFGMGWLDAICHAFTTLSTGGFSTRNASLGAYDSLPIELVTLVFMFIAGANFPLLYDFVIHGRFRPRHLWRSPEFRLYTYVTTLLITVVTVLLWAWGARLPDPEAGTVHLYADFGRCLRDAAFNVISILTSTGYATADFQNWPRTAVVILLLCMFLGACTGSTSGGLKMLRLLVSLKLITYTVRHFIRPKSIEKLKIDEDVLPNSVISAVLAMILLWLTSTAIGAVLLALESRLDFLGALATSISMMGCTGPAMTSVVAASDGTFALALEGSYNVGPYGSFGNLSGMAKILMSFQMLLGRLEILPLLALFAPSFWRR